MGFSSYECRHCGHSIIHPGAATPGINTWMCDVVMMTSNGSRLITEYTGYEGDFEDFSINDSVWVHQACWEIAGKPGYEAYDGPSLPAGDQGHFFDTEHDLIDPRITDEAERARLLDEGIAKRKAAEYDYQAHEVGRWLAPGAGKEVGGKLWKLRYYVGNTLLVDDGDNILRDENGHALWNETQWRITDRFNPNEKEIFDGTEAELEAHMAAKWSAFVESDECKAYLERRRQIGEKARAERFEEIKKEGRFTVLCCDYPGDTVKKPDARDWTGVRRVYAVRDTMFSASNRPVALFDGPNNTLGQKTYYGVYPKDRIDEVQRAAEESRKSAEAEAKRLNKQWAADGYPWDWDAMWQPS